jgi:23S rRNA (adenine2503-C2)-methyltransferase
MRCTFCATGKGGFARNLQAHEIIDQVMTIEETFQQRPTNVGKQGEAPAPGLAPGGGGHPGGGGRAPHVEKHFMWVF